MEHAPYQIYVHPPQAQCYIPPQAQHWRQANHPSNSTRQIPWPRYTASFTESAANQSPDNYGEVQNPLNHLRQVFSKYSVQRSADGATRAKRATAWPQRLGILGSGSCPRPSATERLAHHSTPTIGHLPHTSQSYILCGLPMQYTTARRQTYE